MEDKPITFIIPSECWIRFSDLAYMCRSEQDRELLVIELLIEEFDRLLEELIYCGPYVVIGDKENGWNVYRRDKGGFHTIAEDEQPGHHKKRGNAIDKARRKNLRYNLAIIRANEKLRKEDSTCQN